MVEISTSLLSVEDKTKIVSTGYALEVAHTDYFHIDVMDGKFVKKDTSKRMQGFSETLKQISNIPLDVHLMVEDVYSCVQNYSSLEPNIITFHKEACKGTEEVQKIIQLIKDKGSRVGISIKPNTKLEEIYEFLPFVHLALVMTVEPGLGGQKLIPDTLQKIQELAKYKEKNNLDFSIEVDGGINLDTAKEVKQAGAEILVCGTAILNAQDYKEVIQKLKEE